MLATEDNKLMLGGLARRHRAVRYKSAHLKCNHTSGFPLPSLAEALRISSVSLYWFNAITSDRDSSEKPAVERLAKRGLVADSASAAQFFMLCIFMLRNQMP